MARMSPEEEAAYALRFGVARSELTPSAQQVYDRLADQQTPARDLQEGSPVDADAVQSSASMPRWVAAAGTALFALVVQGFGVVLLPYAFTHWRPGPAWPLGVRAFGIALIVVGAGVVIWAFVQFAVEGIGVPIPGEPNSRRLIVGGPYRHLRNPLYLGSVLNITGQALLLGRPVLLVYAAVFLALTAALARWIEDPALAARFGAEFDSYRGQVHGWWPRLPHRVTRGPGKPPGGLQPR